MSKYLALFRSPTYSNTGSTARDHLASERTFLAWLRTGLGFIALGIAIERFSTLEPLITHTLQRVGSQDDAAKHEVDHQRDQKSVNMSYCFTALGSTAILYGTQRYLTNLRSLQRAQFKPAYWGVMGFVGAVIGIGSYGMWGTLTREPKGGPTVKNVST